MTSMDIYYQRGLSNMIQQSIQNDRKNMLDIGKLRKSTPTKPPKTIGEGYKFDSRGQQTQTQQREQDSISEILLDKDESHNIGTQINRSIHSTNLPGLEAAISNAGANEEEKQVAKSVNMNKTA